MTLCIAAECEYRGNPTIALCSDWRAQTGAVDHPGLMTGSDDAFKTMQFRGATVMLSGSNTRAKELAAVCYPSIRAFVESQVTHYDLDLAIDELLQNLRRATTQRIAELIRLFVESSTGIPHSEFIRLPTDQYASIWHGVSLVNLAAEVLIATVKHEPIIIRVDRRGAPHWENNYSAIGDGSEIARAMLCMHMWTPASQHHPTSQIARAVIPLEECVFRLGGAHAAAHTANPSSVGGMVAYQILTAHYRSSIKWEFVEESQRIFAVQHQVPQFKRKEPKNSLLQTFQSLSTGEAQDEPDEL